MFNEFMGMKIRTGPHGQQDIDVIREVLLQDVYKLGIRGICSGNPSIVVDVGAHIGAFAVAWYRRNPAAKIICVEVCPENIAPLRENTEGIAVIEQGACTYDDRELCLLNSIKPTGTATGGSTVAAANQLNSYGDLYWLDQRPIRKLSLENIMHSHDLSRIDCLKLDCEGSEFSILENAQCLDHVGFICGEYHGRERWSSLIQNNFANWVYAHIATSGELGIFHLQNPDWVWR